MIKQYDKGALFPHGGARLNAGRSSAQLTAKQCKDLLGAAQIAFTMGSPFNRFCTALWEQGGIDARNIAKATGRFIKLASDWLRNHGYRLIWAWVQEYGRINGAHVHILLHIPPELNAQFRSMPMKWVKRILPQHYPPKLWEAQKIGTAQSPFTMSHVYEAQLMAKVHYMLKCAPAALEHELGMIRWRYPFTKSWGCSGIVFGKRLGIWQGWHCDGQIWR